MDWKCSNCNQIFEVSSESSIRFCPNCGTKIDLEQPSHKESAVQQPSNICPVCSTEIQATDETIICPDCKIVYHKDCWNDNNGCATYGCKSAGCLNPPPMKVDYKDVKSISDDRQQVPVQATPHPTYSQDAEGTECPFCHTKLASGTQICWACGKDITTASKFSDTNGYNLSLLSLLSTALKIFGILALVLSLALKADPQNNGLALIVFILAIITNVIWITLWITMKKSTASVVTLAAILFGLLFIGGLIVGYFFLFATTNQAKTIIKNKGKVQITFWGVKPINVSSSDNAKPNEQ